MKIGFVVLANKMQDGEQNKAHNSRSRVLWACKYDRDLIVSENFDVLKQCDAVVFQSRFHVPDIKLARKLKEQNVKIIFDFTDPHWLKEYDPNAVHPVFNDVVNFGDMFTFCTEELARTFSNVFKKVKTDVVPDRFDPEVYDCFKIHQDKNQFTILWHGSYSTRGGVELARNDLEKLGQEFNLKLLCIYDETNKYKINSFKNIKLETREWDGDRSVVNGLLESDISINPKFDNWKSYKSNNKTIVAWACGIPCVERNFYDEIKRLLSSTKVRQNEAIRCRIEAIEKYSADKTAKQWKLIVSNLKNVKEKNIVVYTSICGKFDGLKENQKIFNNADYFAFVDDVAVYSEVWDVRHVFKRFEDPCLQAKIYKVLPWQFFDCEYSIWIDGTISIKVDPQMLIDKFLKKHDIAIFKHAQRDDIYEENEIDILVHRREPRKNKDMMIEKYKKEGLGEKKGLWENGVLIRRHTEKIKRLCETWWAEITSFTTSDLIPFMYALSKHNVAVNPITPGNVYNNSYFEFVEHHRTWDKTFKGSEKIKVNDINIIEPSNIFIKEDRGDKIFILTKDGKKHYVQK